MPISMTPYRVFDSYRSITPACFMRHGIRLLLCDLDYTLAPKSQPEPDADLRRWLSDVRAAGVEVMLLSTNRGPVETAMLGDKLLTDMLGANRAGVLPLMVEPLGGSRGAWNKVLHGLQRPWKAASLKKHPER